jgi:alpha-glucosidase
MTCPNEGFSVIVKFDGNLPTYNISQRCETLITDSNLGLAIDGVSISDCRFLHLDKKVIDQSWEPVWGKQRLVRDHCNEYTIQTRVMKPRAMDMDIVFRVYNEAVAFRYILKSIEGNPKITITDDLAQFRFANDGTAWSYNGENTNIGPEQIADASGQRRWPITVKAADDCWMAVLEANIDNFSWMTLKTEKGSNGFETTIEPSSIELPFAMPWRVLMIGDSAASLVDSNILPNLNPPCKIEDTSWIKPGVCFWDWRAWGHQVDGFTYDLNRESWDRFVDFAAEKEIPYLLLDADWYGPEFEQGSDPTTSEKNVPAFIQYANSKGIGVFLYLNDVGAKKYGLERILKQFADWGAVGIKYGFMRQKPGQAKVNRTSEIIRMCAEYKLMCNFHDNPAPPNGDYRTWPNCLTREYCHSQSDAKRAFVPSTFTTSVFVNMLAGPLDMCNGMFDLDNCEKERPKIFAEVPSTLTAETARTLIVFSGLTVIPDSPDAYKQHPVLFDFIASQKMPWDESKTLAGEMGEYIVMMRRTGDTYFVAASGNEQKRTLKIVLDFLRDGDYKAVISEDTPETHYLTNRQAYKTREITVDKTKTITLNLAPGGGACIKLTPLALKRNNLLR